MISRGLAVLVACAFLYSCSKADAPLKNRVSNRHDIQTHRPACKEADLHNNLFEKENLLSLMRCLKLGQKYPAVSQLIAGSDPEGFSALVGPLNKGFFENNARARTIDYVRDNLNENVKAQLKDVFEEAPEFARRFNFFRAVNDVGQKGEGFFPSSEFFTNLSAFYRASEATTLKRKNISFFLEKLEGEGLVSFKKWSDVALAGLLSNTDRFSAFISRIQFLSKKNGIAPRQLNDLAEFVSSLDADFFKNTERLETLILNDKTYSCSEAGYQINLYQEYRQQLKGLKQDDESAFFESFKNLVFKFKLLEELCDDPKATLPFSRFLQTASDFLRLPGAVDLTRAYLLSEAGSEDILKFISGKTMRLTVGFLSDLRERGVLGEFTQLLGDFSNTLGEKDVKAYAQGVALLKASSAASIIKKLHLANGEQFSSFFFLKFILGGNFGDLAQFIASMQKNWPNVFADLASLVENDQRVRDLFSNWQRYIQDPEALKDLDGFFRSNDLGRLFSLIFTGAERSVGPSTAPPDSAPVLVTSSSIVATAKARTCMKALSQSLKEPDLANFIERFPHECKNGFPAGMAERLFYYAADVERVFQREYGQSFIRGTGVLSSEMLEVYLSFLLLVKEHGELFERRDIEKAVGVLGESLLSKTVLAKILDGLEFLSEPKGKYALETSLNYFTEKDPLALDRLLKGFFNSKKPRSLLIPQNTEHLNRFIGRENPEPFTLGLDRSETLYAFIDFMDPSVATSLGGVQEGYLFNLKKCSCLLTI